MEDITPGLVERITEDFHHAYDESGKIQTLLEKVQKGTATYAEAQEYSLEVSRLIGKAYSKNVSSAVLPDGRMYYNIASRLIPASMDENYALVSQYAASVQKELNRNAGIGIQAKVADKSQDRIDGLVELACGSERYDDVAQKLLSAFDGFSQSVVDDTIQKNAQLHYDAGMSPKIRRKAEWKCCDWCRALEGEYDYPDVPPDVYRRHERCRCTVLYDPADGKRKRQNIHTKKWTDPNERDNINIGKRAALGGDKKVARGILPSGGDPMAEVTGPAERSNPKELQGFFKEISDSKVELVRHDTESLGYCPGLRAGQPGQLYISEGASYSAWCHEMQHMREDRAAGWRGMRILANLDERYASEQRAYGIEIEMARKLDREDIVQRLEANLEMERRKIYGD